MFQELDVIGFSSEGKTNKLEEKPLLAIDESGEDVILTLAGVKVTNVEMYEKYIEDEIKGQQIQFMVLDEENVESLNTLRLKGVMYSDGTNVNVELVKKNIAEMTEDAGEFGESSDEQ